MFTGSSTGGKRKMEKGTSVPQFGLFSLRYDVANKQVEYLQTTAVFPGLSGQREADVLLKKCK